MEEVDGGVRLRWERVGDVGEGGGEGRKGGREEGREGRKGGREEGRKEGKRERGKERKKKQLGIVMKGKERGRERSGGAKWREGIASKFCGSASSSKAATVPRTPTKPQRKQHPHETPLT